MKAGNQERSSEQRLNDFLGNICPPKIAKNDNDNPIEKSRWAKWQFTKTGAGKDLEFHQLEKSESKIINRLLDRLDPSAGKARHAAKVEIIKLLKTNGIEITADIKKYLPDTLKLGNINALGESIQNAILLKKNQQLNDINKFKELIEQHVSEKVVDEGSNQFLRTSDDEAYKKSRQIFSSELKFVLIDFSENLKKELLLMNKPMSEEAFLEFIEEKIGDLYNNITETNQFKNIRHSTYESIRSALIKKHNVSKISKENAEKILDQLDKSLNTALILSGLSTVWQEIMVDNKDDFMTAIKRLVPSLNDDNKILNIFLKEISSGLINHLKMKAMYK